MNKNESWRQRSQSSEKIENKAEQKMTHLRDAGQRYILL